MNFTREPIIETIISAKEGYKLSIKSSKGAGVEEYLVDAIEVVSFGGSFFYRSGERPKAFFLPANDYEIVEVRETRLLIKQPSIEKSIKIGGGKESSKRREEEAKPEAVEAEGALPTEETPKTEQKRDRRRNRRGRRGGAEEAKPQEPQQPEMAKEAPAEPAVPMPPPVLSHLLQPPEGLISDSLKKYKRSEEAPTAPGIAEELATHIERSIGEGIMGGPIGPESPSADPELISEPPTREELPEPLYSALDESELPPGIE